MDNDLGPRRPAAAALFTQKEQKALIAQNQGKAICYLQMKAADVQVSARLFFLDRIDDWLLMNDRSVALFFTG